VVGLIKWVCLFLSVVYAIDNIRNRVRGYGVDLSRKLLVVSGVIGFIVCQNIGGV
jgi:hypothetical protein